MSITKQTSKIIPASKGVLQNAVTGIGADRLMTILDNMVGSPVQRIASINLPLLGTVGPIDVINYIGHAGGFKLSKKGFIAVISAKVANNALTALGPIRLPGGGGGASSATSAPTAAAPGGASF